MNQIYPEKLSIPIKFIRKCVIIFYPIPISENIKVKFRTFSTSLNVILKNVRIFEDKHTCKKITLIML